MGCPYEPKIYQAVAGVTEVRNVVLTKGGCGYLHAVIQIKKSTQGDAKNAIMAAFAAHTSLKHVVVVDEDIDPCNPHDVEYAIATRVSGDRDVMVITGVRGSSLDPCQLEDGTNVKVGVDATMVLGREDGVLACDVVNRMQLEPEDERILAGEEGETRQRMLELLVALGKVFGAEQLVRIRSAQVSGASYKTIGEYGLQWLNSLDAKAVVPAVLNPIGMPRGTLAGDGR